MQENIDSFLLNTRLDSALAELSILPTKQRRELDQAFQDWLRASSARKPDVAETNEDHGVIVARNMMRWRCLNSQFLIHRPLVLWYTMSRRPLASLPSSEQNSVRRCWHLATNLIEDIHETWDRPTPCQMSAWYATWQLYQAAMVPILLLYCEQDHGSHAADCTKQIETAMTTLTSLEAWCPTGKRTLEVITRLYEASKTYAQAHPILQSPPYDIQTEAQLRRSGRLNSDQSVSSASADTPAQITFHGLDDLSIDLSGFAPTEYDDDMSFLSFFDC